MDHTQKKSMMMKAISALAVSMGLAMPNAQSVTKSKRLTARRVRNMEARQYRRTRILTPEETLIKGMSNWQHHQMMKACKGKIGNLSIETLEKFATLEHWKKTV